MNIDRQTVDHIAHLARLEFDDKGAEQMARELTKILDWVDELKAIDTEGVKPLIHPSVEVNVLRNDEPKAPIDHDRALRNAPKHDSNYFRVPKVIE